MPQFSDCKYTKIFFIAKKYFKIGCDSGQVKVEVEVKVENKDKQLSAVSNQPSALRRS